MCDGRREPARARVDLFETASERMQRRQPCAQSIRIAIQSQRCLDRSEPDLVDSQSALQGIAIEARDQVAAPDDETRLRAAEQLVAGERHEVGAIRDHVGHGRLLRQTPARRVEQCSRTQIDNQR
jgi:hypothetical protein